MRGNTGGMEGNVAGLPSEWNTPQDYVSCLNSRNGMPLSKFSLFNLPILALRVSGRPIVYHCMVCFSLSGGHQDGGSTLHLRKTVVKCCANRRSEYQFTRIEYIR